MGVITLLLIAVLFGAIGLSTQGAGWAWLVAIGLLVIAAVSAFGGRGRGVAA